MPTKISRRKFAGLTLTGIAATGLTVFLRKCTSVLGPYSIENIIDRNIKCAFRFTDFNSLLNLEYYFINCTYKPSAGKVWAKYGPHENYMVVRLPQQHVAEKNFELDKLTDFKAFTYISGYSYLVFRILFYNDEFTTFDNSRFACVDLNKKDLLDWGNEKKFRLVVRQDLSESFFDLKRIEFYQKPEAETVRKLKDNIEKKNKIGEQIRGLTDSIKVIEKPYLENHYPFQTGKKDALKDTFNINLIPKVYGDPVTAIELPWRLIISPRLPNSNRFKFKWDIPETDLGKKKLEDTHKHQLWIAKLSITERIDYLDRKKDEEKYSKKNEKESSSDDLAKIINQLELMILGSPDADECNIKYDEILPTSAHRRDLVGLYIKLKVLAKTESITFSSLGASTAIHLKNDKIEDAIKNGIRVIEWNQIISLGRDEKVEVSTLFLEAEFGHKMAYIEIAERQLRNGSYPLIKKAFIMPLDITKDYTTHLTQTLDQNDQKGNKKLDKIVSKFNAPFRKITFLETKPKLLFPQNSYKQNDLTQTETSFEFEAIDWHNNVIRFSKKINAIPFGYAANLSTGLSSMIAPADNKLYQSDCNLTSLTDSIPFKKARDLDSLIKTNDLTRKTIETIDALIKEQRDSIKNFNGVMPLAFPKILDTDKIESIYTRFEDFVQIFRDEINKKIQKDLIKVDDIINDSSKLELDIEKIVLTLFRKYLTQNLVYQNSIQQFLNQISNFFASVNGYLNWEKNYKDKTDFASLIGDILANATVKGLYDKIDIKNTAGFASAIKNFIENREFIGILKIWQDRLKNTYQTLQSSAGPLDNKLNDELKAFLKQTEKNSYYLYEFLETNSPDFIKIINDLKQILNTELKDRIVNSLTNRIQQLYEIEDKAKKIPGIILLQKQKIGYAIKEAAEKVSGEVKKSLSQLESEYILFEGGLRKSANDAFDFFNEHAIIPQVRQAKVYVSTLNKLVNEELPISINYARDYLENQVDDAEFEIKENAAMVFGEVQQSSRELVKGMVQKIGDKMPGLNVEVPAHLLTYARNPSLIADEFVSNVKKEINLPGDFEDQMKNFSRDLVFVSDEVNEAVKIAKNFRNADPKKYFKDLGAKLFGSIALEDILDIGFDIPRITELPDKLIYQASTDKFKNFRAAFVAFTPHVKGTTRLDLFISKSLKNAQDYNAYTKLNNFSIGVIMGGAEVLTIFFEQFKITSTPGNPKKTDITITDVKLGGPLEFIADLAQKFMAPGNGMRIKPGPRSLLVDYTIVFPDISAPAFNFRNLQLIIGVNIPYDPSSLKEISFILGVNKPEDKFLISAGIYGGRGHFQLRATPKGIQQIDIAMELGAYASINLGIGKGEVFLFFGFWFVTGKDDDGNSLVKAVAYVICAGSATVLGFITIGVSVLIALTYIKRGGEALFYGEAVVTYSVKIAFFKKEFSIRYYKEIAGSSNGASQQSTQQSSLLNINTSSSGKVNDGITEKKNFTDFFDSETAFDEYLSCFA